MRVHAVITLSLLSGCALGDFQADGRACPCGPEYVCDEAQNVCVRSIAEVDAGTFNTVAADSGVDAGLPPMVDGSTLDSGEVAEDGGIAIDSDAGSGDADTADAEVALDAEANPDGGDIPRDGGVIPRDGGVIPRDGGPPDAGPCTTNLDCARTDELCLEGACILRCDAPGATACPPGNVCDPSGGQCITALAIGEDCAADWQCDSSICLSTNASGGTQSFCSELCSRTSDCPTLHSCLEINELRHCVRTTAFNPAPTFTTPTPGACTAGNTCQSGVCNNQTQMCVERCSSTNDCNGFGGNCWVYNQQTGESTQLCYVPPTGTSPSGAACTADSQCLTNVCDRDRGVCGNPCCTNTDCQAQEQCTVYQLDANDIMKLCRPIPNAGAATYFSACTADTDCLSGKCIPENAAVPNGPRICSTTCCKNSDCSAIVADARCTATPGPIAGSQYGVCRR